MLIQNKTKGAVRIKSIDFAKDEIKAFPDSYEVPQGFERVDKPKVETPKEVKPKATLEKSTKTKQKTKAKKSKKD